MWIRRNCSGKGGCRFPVGSLLITLGAGILLAYIIPYYILITMLGVALVAAGICCIRKK